MTLSTSPQINYPESDGQPLADNTIQFRLIVTIQGELMPCFWTTPMSLWLGISSGIL